MKITMFMVSFKPRSTSDFEVLEALVEVGPEYSNSTYIWSYKTEDDANKNGWFKTQQAALKFESERAKHQIAWYTECKKTVDLALLKTPRKPRKV